MKAVIIEKPGNYDEFKEAEVETPQIKEDEVLVEVRATSINPIDIQFRKGNIDTEFPAILSSDISGIISEVGDNVTKFEVGDEVFGRNEMNLGGGFGEYAALNQEYIVKKPKQVSFEQAATLGIAALTAYQLVHEHGDVQGNDKVLIKGGSGGVGTFAIQLAKLAGAEVAATTSQNEDLLNQLGVDQVINYKETDPTEAVKDVDVLIVAVGEGDIYLKTVKKGGRAFSPATSFDEEKTSELAITAKRISHNLKLDQLEKLAELITTDQLIPIIGQKFPLTAEGVREAHKLSESGHAKGKIVVTSE